MFIYQDMIKKEVCDDLIKAFKNSKEKIKVNNTFTKMTNTIWSFHNIELHDYFNELNKVLKKYIEKYKYVDEGQEPWNLNSRIQIQKYEPQESYFSWHSESTGFKNSNNRILVFTTYLNDIEDGGETEFFYQKEKIKPEKGKTILFPAFWTHTHKGNITKETKYIITGWYTYVH
tara:strand:+ start:45 stop:566 length:522 start_codon:yes stop_codon:yes gene_type:complete